MAPMPKQMLLPLKSIFKRMLSLALLSEQRAMQVVHRFQTLSILALKEPDEQTDARPEDLPPTAAPTSLLAMLPQEWPLARLSVQLRHVGVLLRVTPYRRLAELSFRGAPFNLLPREVAREVRRDFDVICGATARQLASLFAFLRPEQTEDKQPDPTGLALYADPDFWLYGLLSFSAKTCEAKTVEARGIR